jgi:hypothetical protein
MEATMGRKFAWILGAALLLTTVLAAPAAAQVGVSIGIGVPPVAAGVVVGAPVYPPYPAYPPYYYPYPAYPYPGPYYYRYPVYGRAYYAPRYYYGPRAPYYYGGRARYYYNGRAPYYRGAPGPVYRGNVQVSPGSYGRDMRSAPSNRRR